MPDSCYVCDKKGDVKRCSGCQHAYYCSRTCQRQHWRRHKPHCIPPQSSLHELLHACFMDVFPSASAALDYGFESMSLYHGDLVLPDQRQLLSPEHVLLGLYQMINRDINLDELPSCGTVPVANSIGASKKMLLEAYEKNALDDFLHRYINSVIEHSGEYLPPENYCFLWLRNRLVIGPTRLLLSESVYLTQEQVVQMRNDISRRYYEASN
ncbi:hypothetical protein OS493_013449 [Desmophyllum pertusum]|uniref:MYND-type domain-containing protein n=1 Tax=Desmophyllum pertusum TaxID=174260 RepID=A0A9W9YGU2_9CNID|nr:hypothetical protein OS493_013449 [Desmophyllum pertusum]